MKPIIILKSLIAGYTRRDGAYVKPHADKRRKRPAAAASDPQLVLFPPPAKKPIPPNPFKGLDPVKSTPDLFEEMQLTASAHHKPDADPPSASPVDRRQTRPVP
jgi:hypothetical protein